MTQLTEVFNEDCALLSHWLGLNLNCEMFREGRRSSRPQWLAVGVPGRPTGASAPARHGHAFRAADGPLHMRTDEPFRIVYVDCELACVCLNDYEY